MFLFYIILMMQPFQVTMVPNYLVLKQFHLLNTHLAVILPGIFSAFPVFIMTKFFASIPTPLIEAARLDGASDFSIFLKVGIPVGRPGIISMLVLGFLEYWNAIEQPMTFLKEQRLWPLSLYLPDITADKAGAAWSASVIMMMLPVLLFIMGQETLEQGIAASGIKECEPMNVKKAAAIFLALMAALTFLSRALDSFTVIRVKTGYGKQDVIPYAIQGEGELTAGRTVYISLPENMQVEEITARPGQSVKAGDTVLTLQMEGLEEERDALTLEYKKAELTFKQEQMSFAPVPRVTEETLALQQLAAAQRALELGNQDLAKAKEDHEKASIELEHDYVQKKNRTREQVKEDNRKAMKSARRSYESAQKSRDSAVRKAEREVEDKQKKLERLEEQGASEEELERAELELDRAGEDLEDIRDEEDLKVEEARAKMYAAEEDYEDVDYGERENQEDLRRAYEDALKAEDDKLEQAGRAWRRCRPDSTSVR